MKVHLVDGTYELFRAFFGVPEARDAAGRPVILYITSDHHLAGPTPTPRMWTIARWTGKNWACHQLACRATGDLLCFVDADTLLEPTA